MKETVLLIFMVKFINEFLRTRLQYLLVVFPPPLLLALPPLLLLVLVPLPPFSTPFSNKNEGSQ